jgi:serine/threonine-protein phosphatase 6 regulatory ankyrin repeat subunit A
MGADIAATNSIQETALLYAARGGQEGVTRLLLERGADVAALTIGRETALHYAVPSRNEAIVKLLLEKGVDLEATSSTGHTALFSVFDVESSCSESILNLLLANGANVNVSEPSRHLTPLYFAAQDGNERAVRSLLANGANVMDRDYLGHTAPHIAAESGNEAVVRMLLKKEAEVSAVAVEEDDTPRNYAKWNGHEAIARLLEEAATQRL